MSNLRCSIGALLHYAGKDDLLAQLQGKRVHSKKEAKPVIKKETIHLEGSDIMAEIQQAEQAGNRTLLSELFKKSRYQGLQHCQREATDALGRLLRGETMPAITPKSTANPIKALLPEEDLAWKENRRRTEEICHKDRLIREYCGVTKGTPSYALRNLTTLELREKIKAARKATARPVPTNKTGKKTKADSKKKKG